MTPPGIPEYKPPTASDQKKDTRPKGRPAKAAKPKPSMSLDTVEEKTAEFISMIGAGCFALPAFQPDGIVLIASADDLAKSYRNIAERNPTFYRALAKFHSGTGAVADLLPTLVVLAAIARNHGAPIPPNPMVPPMEVYYGEAMGKMGDMMEDMEDVMSTAEEPPDVEVVDVADVHNPA